MVSPNVALVRVLRHPSHPQKRYMRYMASQSRPGARVVGQVTPEPLAAVGHAFLFTT